MAINLNSSNASYLDNWIPIEWDSEVISRVLKTSSVEALAQRHNMQTSTKRILRQSGYTVTSGRQYSVDSGELDYVVLTARRFMGQSVLDEDDLADTEMIVDTIAQRAMDYAISYATALDNACLGVTAAENSGSDTSRVPFTSIYRAVRNNGTGAEDDYVADANYVNYNGQASAAYDKFSEALRLVEVSDYWDENNAYLIAHPAFRDVLRRTKDNNGTPIFVQGQGGDSGQPDTLFGVPIFWSRGAKTSATMTDKPEGNPLLIFVGDRNLMKLGVRSGPESRLDVSTAHHDVDDTAVKFRTRRGFQIGRIAAFSVLEKTA
jgi:HK97 family phage major capsid protein